MPPPNLTPPCFFIHHPINIPSPSPLRKQVWDLFSCLLAWLPCDKTLFASNLGVSAIWYAVHQARQTWFGIFIWISGSVLRMELSRGTQSCKPTDPGVGASVTGSQHYLATGVHCIWDPRSLSKSSIRTGSGAGFSPLLDPWLRAQFWVRMPCFQPKCYSGAMSLVWP